MYISGDSKEPKYGRRRPTHQIASYSFQVESTSVQPHNSQSAVDSDPAYVYVGASFVWRYAHAKAPTWTVAYARPRHVRAATSNYVSVLLVRPRLCERADGSGSGWLGGLGSIDHSYGNVSNYRTELLAGAEDPVGQPVLAWCRRGKGGTPGSSARLSFASPGGSERWREREKEKGREKRHRCASTISTLRPLPLTGMRTWSQETERYDL